MAKKGSIKHYRQVGDAREPAALPYGELAVAKDGTVFAGNQHGQPISKVDLADTAGTATKAFDADKAARASVAATAEKVRAADSSTLDEFTLDLTPSVDTASGTFHFGSGGPGSMTLYAYDHCVEADKAARGSFGVGRVTLVGADGSLTVSGASSLRPAADNATALGAPGARYSTVYAATGSISTSDRRAKNSIRQLDGAAAQKFMAELLPVTYQLNDGESGRRHWGLIAQDVERAMTLCGIADQDFAGFVRAPRRGAEGRLIEGAFDYGLRYEEFIAPLVACVQQLLRDRDECRARLALLEQQLDHA